MRYPNPIMKIHQITLENFRCFSKKTIKLYPQFNVLIGDNGSGKTAILDALAIGAGTFLLGIEAHPARGIRKDDPRRVSSLNEFVPTIEAQYPVRVMVDGTVDGQSLSWHRSVHTAGSSTTQKHSRNIRNIAEHLQDQVRAQEKVTLPLIAYYGTGRMWYMKPRYVFVVKKSPNGGKSRSEAETVPPGSRLDGYKKCLDADTNQSFLDRWLKTYEISVLQRQTPNSALDGIKEAVAGCMERWTRITYDILLDELLAVDGEGNRMPTRLLSDGQRNILYMVLDIAYRAVTLNPHFEYRACRETPGIVLIDEIDLHLHPRWQRHVVDDLRKIFPNVQFIVTTHSPLIVQSLRQGELIDINDDDPGDYVNRSPEDILENVMEVEMPQRGERSQQMIRTAEEYYDLLANADKLANGHLKALRERLDILLEPYADNEAYVALLRQKRAAAGIDGD